MIYEVRLNRLLQNYMAVEFVEEWVKPFIPFLEKYGAKFVAGIFQPLLGGETNHIWYIMSYDDLAHRERVYQAIDVDEDFQKQRVVWSGKPNMLKNMTLEILKSYEYSPK